MLSQSQKVALKLAANQLTFSAEIAAIEWHYAKDFADKINAAYKRDSAAFALRTMQEEFPSYYDRNINTGD